ncbi:response regulator [Cohnella suwonensis]|uniref:Response regulator n=1 Tax=Cohnella suwonensis TaxID=696072 RepID=A0ABW0LZC9_9BACL
MRVLIVDDESAVHEQLMTLIPWEELGWEVVGHAYNGEDAKKLTETYRPNLILTDLKMPLLDGLGFMSWLEKSGNAAKVIVLSGYGEFEYSRSAFLLGAYDYLLKPIQESELLVALGKAVDQIRRDTLSQSDRINEKAVLGEGLTLKQDEFLTQAIGASLTDENEIVVQAERLMLRLPENGYAAIAVRFLDFEEQMQARYEGDRTAFYFAARNIMREISRSSSLVFRNLRQSNEFVLIKSLSDKKANLMEPMLSKLQRLLDEGLKMRSVIGVSTCKQRISKLAAAYSESQIALESLKIAGDLKIAFHDPLSASIPKGTSTMEMLWSDIGLLFDLLAETGSLRDNDKLIAKIEQAFHEKTIEGTSVSEWKQAMSDLVRKIDPYPMNEDMRILLNEVKASVQAVRIPYTKELLLKWTELFMARNADAMKSKSGKPLIDAIKKYIDENYKTVSLDQAAERFYLNKNYFCSLFKNMTDVSFMEYVTDLRMEHAKRLLANSNLKTYEVAEMVGYSDQRYFSQVFRKHTGTQPTQYRQNKSNKDDQA